MENKFEKIEFNVERDFSDTFNVSFKFLKQNFKPLLKTLIYLVGPFLFITALLSGIFTQNAFDIQSLMSGTGSPLDMFGPMYFLTILSTLVSALILIGITFEYVILYDEKGYAGFEIIDVWKAFVKDLGRIIGAFFGLLLIAILFVIIIGVVFGLLSLMGTVGGVFIGILSFLMVIGMLIAGPPIMFLLTVVYLIVIREKIGFWEAFSKARFLLKDNFWNTWVVTFVAYLIVGILSVVFTIPQSIAVGLVSFNSIQGGESDYSIIVIIFTMIGVLGGSLVNTLLYIMMSFQYYSLNEQKQGVGLLSQIDAIGADNSKDEDITI